MRIRSLVIFIIAALALNACDAVKKASRETEPAERVFNAANEAMTRGDNAAAIDLYYKILEKYPDFKQYRADSLYRLGVLLFRSERFEESEKILGIFIIKYKNHEKIKDAYEKLLYIYTREKKDPAKALKIREIYEKKYGKSGAVEIADRSEKILSGPLSGSYGSLGLLPNEISVVGVEKVAVYDAEFYPVVCRIEMKKDSPDMKMTVERKKTEGGRYLFLSVDGGKERVLAGTLNGYGQQWSWDNSRLFFTVMDWKRKERHIKVHDMKTGVTRDIFYAGKVAPLICPSPEGGLVAFWYSGKIWLAESNGRSASMIYGGVPEEGVFMMAWSREGDRLLVGKNTKNGVIYYSLKMGRKEFILAK